MGDVYVGSACEATWLIVTVGPPHATVWSVLVEAAFGLPAASVAVPAPTVAMMEPAVVMPVTATLYVVPLPVTVPGYASVHVDATGTAYYTYKTTSLVCRLQV